MKQSPAGWNSFNMRRGTAMLTQSPSLLCCADCQTYLHVLTDSHPFGHNLMQCMFETAADCIMEAAIGAAGVVVHLYSVMKSSLLP